MFEYRIISIEGRKRFSPFSPISFDPLKDLHSRRRVFSRKRIVWRHKSLLVSTNAWICLRWRDLITKLVVGPAEGGFITSPPLPLYPSFPPPFLPRFSFLSRSRSCCKGISLCPAGYLPLLFVLSSTLLITNALIWFTLIKILHYFFFPFFFGVFHEFFFCKTLCLVLIVNAK